jgi:hypothetical protein
MPEPLFLERGICLPDNSFHTFIDPVYNSNPRFANVPLGKGESRPNGPAGGRSYIVLKIRFLGQSH